MLSKVSTHLPSFLPGLILSLGLAGLSYAVSLLERSLTGVLLVGPILLAILLGVLGRNLFRLPEVLDPGIRFSFRPLLRLGVIGLGFDFSAHEILSVGPRGFLLDLSVILAVYGASFWIGRKKKLPDTLSLLLGTGTAICGASAIVAVNSVVKGRDEEVAFSVATVTLFGTLSMFLFPLADRFLHLPAVVYGAWAGSSIHEVGQVIGATLPYSHESLELGTVLKLTRIAFLLPVILILEGILLSQSRGTPKKGDRARHFPWFVVGFGGVVAMNVFVPIPPALLETLQEIDAAVLTVAMAAMGLETRLSRLVRFGLKPVGLGLLLWIFVSVMGLILSIFLYSSDGTGRL